MRQAIRNPLPASKQSGFSLIELMIALILGLLVIGAALAVFRTNQVTYRANEGQNRIQENVRIAFELISRDIRAAGGMACSGASFVESSGTYSTMFRDAPVAGTGSEVTVTSGDDTAYRTTATSATSVTLDSAQVPDVRDVIKVNDWILLCNARKTFLIQATAVTTNTVSFAALPENYNPGTDPLGTQYAVMLARVRNVRWFVAANGRGGSSLFVSRFGRAGEEVAEGVSNMTVEYLDSTTGAYGSSSVNWPNVSAVRIAMTFTGQDVDGRALTRNASSTFSLRSRAL